MYFPLEKKEIWKNKTTGDCSFLYCLDRYEIPVCKNDIDIWFSSAIGMPCILVRSSASENHLCSNRNETIPRMCRDLQTRLNFVNEGQFLLISEASVADLNSRLKSSKLYAPFLQHRMFFHNQDRFYMEFVVVGPLYPIP